MLGIIVQEACSSPKRLELRRIFGAIDSDTTKSRGVPARHRGRADLIHLVSARLARATAVHALRALVRHQLSHLDAEGTSEPIDRGERDIPSTPFDIIDVVSR